MEQAFYHQSANFSELPQDEPIDPQQVLTELFDFAHLPELKSVLWEWLKATVSGSYNKTMKTSERENILVLYEHLQKLLEASHIIYQEQQKLDAFRKDIQRHIF